MPLRPLILRYLAVMLVCIVVLIVADALLLHYLAFETSNGTAVVTTIVPAMDAGQAFAKRTGRLPQKRESWRISTALSISGVAASLVLAVLLVLASGLDLAPLIEALGLPLIATILLAVGVLTLLMTRWFFGIGARGMLRRQQKVAYRDLR